jgi:hypothetical protein
MPAIRFIYLRYDDTQNRASPSSCVSNYSQSKGAAGETCRRIGGSACRRVGTRGAVGLRSRATGVAWPEPVSPRIELRRFFISCSHVPWTCNAGRAGALPYRATLPNAPTSH